VTVGTLDRRTLLMLVAGVAVVLFLRFVVYSERTPQVVQSLDSIPMGEKRVLRLRQIAATVPGRQRVLQQARAELADREKQIIRTDTAAQAQAQLLELIRRLGKANSIDVRGAEELRVRPLSDDYGEVSVSVSFNCAIEQFVNFMAALANEPQLVATNEIRINSANAKEKTVGVRLSLSGVVPRKLVPEKKGVAAF
jgi:hypothetical protein